MAVLSGISTGKAVAAVLAAVVVVGGGGYAAMTMFGGQSGGAAPPLDSVPSGVDTVAVVDGDVVTHDTTERAMNTFINETESETAPESYQALLDQAENETGLDPRGLNYAVVYSQLPDRNATSPPKSGAIVTSDWSNEDVREAMENSTSGSLNETTYNGVTVYVNEREFGQSQYIAFLGDGTYAFASSEEAVHDVIDVSEGDAEPFSGELRNHLTDRPDSSLIWFASAIPSDQIPDRSSGQIDVSQFAKIDYVSGAYYAPNSTHVGITTAMHTNSSSSAEDVYDVVNGAVSLMSGSVKNETIGRTLDRVEVSQDGSTVTVTYEDSLDNLGALAEAARQMGGGVGPQLDPEPTPSPQVLFEYDYDAQSDAVTITHTGGDSVDAGTLTVVVNSEMRQVTTDEQTLTAGDTVTVEDVQPGDYVRVVWESPDGTASAVLGSYQVQEEQ